MAELRQGDQDMHYSDSSHRWIAPPDVDQNVWNARVRAHLDAHRSTMGAGPGTVSPVDACRPPRIPRQRRPSQLETTGRVRRR